MTELNALMASPFVRVKLVTFVHFIFIGNAMISTWAPGVYLFCNILFLLALFWTMHCKESPEAVHTALVVNVCSIFFDLVSIIIFFSHMNGWALAFSIINLVCRPFTSILLHREFSERGGSLQTGQIFPSSQQTTYQDIDRPNQPVPSNNQPPPNVPSIF